VNGLELCRYQPDRGVDYYAGCLAGLLKVAVGPHRESTHAYVKEVRKAMETLVFSIWDNSDEFIRVVAEANIPSTLQSGRARECFKELLIGLLKKFRETTDNIPIGSRIRLMNMVISAIAEMARRGTVPPEGQNVLSNIFSSKKSDVEGGE